MSKNSFLEQLKKLWGKFLDHDFFKQSREFYINICLGIIVGFSGIFILKRLLSSPTIYFCKYVMENKQEERDSFEALPVEAATAKLEKTQKRLSTLGTVKASQHVVIKTQQQNVLIRKILFKEGTFVDEGTPLIEFDNETAKAQYEEEKAKRDAALLNFKRKERLYQQGSESKAEFDKANGEYKAAEARLNQAEEQLNKMTIRAPISGTIGIIESVNIGSIPSQGQPLVTIVNDDLVNIFFKIPLKHYDELSLGQKILFQSESFQTEFEGSIEAIDSKIEESTILVRATINNNNKLLKSGLLGEVEVITDKKINAFVLPETAIFKHGEKDYIHSIYKNRILSKQVVKGAKVSIKGKNFYIIEQGLKEGTQFIQTVNPQKMLEGMPVIITKLDNEDLLQKAEQQIMKRKKESGPVIQNPLLTGFCRYMLGNLEDLYKETLPLSVSVINLQYRTVHKKIPAVGQIKSQKYVELKTQLQHYQDHPVTEIFFSEGERVKENDILIQLSNKEVKERLAEEKARMDSAETQYKRIEALFKAKADTKSNLEKHEAEYKVSMARFLNTYTKLKQLAIYAPFSGEIGIMEHTTKGTVPQPDKVLVTIVDDETVNLFFRIPAKYIKDIGLDQSIIFKVDTYENEEFEGNVVAVDSIVEEVSQTMLVRAEIHNKNKMLKSGMIGRIELIIDTKEKAIAVPESALGGLSDKVDIVFTVKNGKAAKVIVDKGFSFVEKDVAYRLITKGLKPGDILISELGANLRPDMTVKITTVDGEPIENLQSNLTEKKEESAK